MCVARTLVWAPVVMSRRGEGGCRVVDATIELLALGRGSREREAYFLPSLRNRCSRAAFVLATASSSILIQGARATPFALT